MDLYRSLCRRQTWGGAHVRFDPVCIDTAFRHPRAAELARDLAKRCGMSMTQAIISALEAEIARDENAIPLSERLLAIGTELRAKAGPNGRRMTHDEIDAPWEPSARCLSTVRR